MKIVLASNNAGKIHELSDLLSHLNIELISQAEFKIEEIEETGLTFIENALIKARHAANLSGLPAIADDSGLVVKALNGAPGIYSARYAGPNAKSKDNIQKLLNKMENIPDHERQAYFFCTLVLMMHAEDPIPLICQEKWNGMILHAPQGEGGFGYDPIFYDPVEKKSAAELPLLVKNKISHRGLALNALLNKLPEKL